MIEYLPEILGFFIIVAIARIFWSTSFKINTSNAKYDAEWRRIQQRKKELGIEYESEETFEPKGSSFIGVAFGFVLVLLIFIISLYIYANS